MTLPTPMIDTRTYEDIVRETEDLAQELSGWQPPARDGGHDAAGGLPYHGGQRKDSV